MRKSIRLKVCVILLALVVMSAIAACGNYDKFGLPKDFVEVEKLEVESGDIKMSPSGPASTYQINVKITPNNAVTNVKLNYYIPSQYLQYVTVSETGLLEARQLTPEGVIVPVTISSTTNKNASVTINVVVEAKDIENIYLENTSAELAIGNAGYQIQPRFIPSNATATVTYTSLNEEIARVDANGYVTAVSAGHTTIEVAARSTNSVSAKTAHLSVNVVYGQRGSYRLDVSDARPPYNFVINGDKKITFNVIKLTPNSDPNVTVYWYIGETERVVSNDNKYIYEHTPTVQAATEYRIKAVVHSDIDGDIVLYSEPISVYEPFNGFGVDYGNITNARSGFQYGEVATFEITESNESVESYDWYLKRLGEGGSGIYIATTSANDRNLTRRLNVEGDFVLTAIGTDGRGEVVTQGRTFEFGVTRFTAGDTLLMTPSLIGGGLPPESYNFYIYDCDENGEIISERRHLGTCLNGETFLYPLSNAGYYKVTAQAISGGVIATLDGEEFTYSSNLIRVDDGRADESHDDDLLPSEEKAERYRVKDYTEISGVNIAGLYDGNEYRALVEWNNVGGVASYVVELTTYDGEVYIFDSDTVNSALFGKNYVLLPSDTAPLDGRFSVRIRHKGSAFSSRYYYGYNDDREEYFSAVPKAAYEYLLPISGTKNSYLSDMKELGELLNYVVLYRPTANELVKFSIRRVDGVAYNAFTFKVYPAFDLKNISDRYPVEIGDWEDAETFDICKAVLGAQNAYLSSGIYRYSFVKNGDGSYDITVMLPDAGNIKTTEKIDFTAGDGSGHYSDTPYGETNSVFAISSREEIAVYDSEQLYKAVEEGYNPRRATDAVAVLYQKALRVVNTIIGNEMTDREKAFAFYAYLTQNVVYDKKLAEKTADDIDNNNYAGQRLEGVFDYRQAVCDGISKAFVLLCGIEGIRAVRVTGEINGVSHAWNKVLIDGKWYVVDATNGSVNTDGKLSTDSKFYLKSDETYFGYFESVVEFGEGPTAETDFTFDDIIVPSPLKNKR